MNDHYGLRSISDVTLQFFDVKKIFVNLQTIIKGFTKMFEKGLENVPNVPVNLDYCSTKTTAVR